MVIHVSAFLQRRTSENSTVIKAVQDVVKSLFDLRNEYIKFRETEQETAARLIRTFEEYSDLPNIAGSINETRIRVEAPKDSAIDYFSRYQQHDFVVQAVVDGRTIFIDWPPNEPKNWRSSIFGALSHANVNSSFTVDWQVFWYFKWILLISADFQKFIVPHPYTTASLIFLLILWNLRNFSGTRKTGSHFKSAYVDKKIRK